jgi:hypothetical protein
VDLLSGDASGKLWAPEDVHFHHVNHLRPDLRQYPKDTMVEWSIKSRTFYFTYQGGIIIIIIGFVLILQCPIFTAQITLELSWCKVMLAHVIWHSTIENKERFAEHLTNTSLLCDFQFELDRKRRPGTKQQQLHIYAIIV